MNMWSYGKDRDGGIRTIFRDGEYCGSLYSGDAVTLIEAVSELERLYTRGATFVATDRFQAMNNVIAEAMRVADQYPAIQAALDHLGSLPLTGSPS